MIASIVGGKRKLKTPSNTLEGAQLLEELRARACHHDLLGRGENGSLGIAATLDDSIKILQSQRVAVLIVLQEFRSLSEVLMKGHSGSGSHSNSFKLFQLERKLYFLLAWANEQHEEIWQDLVSCCVQFKAGQDARRPPSVALPWKLQTEASRPPRPHALATSSLITEI